MKTEYRNKGLAPVLAALAFVVAFSLVLAFAVNSLGSADGKVKTAREAPDSLVSAGAPRSQLELKRFFESVSADYTEDGRKIYEPISTEYLASVEEGTVLSIEEILFIISDTVAAWKKYDVIRFRSATGDVEYEIEPRPATQTGDLPFHRAARETLGEVVDLIRLRIEYMSAEGAMKEETHGAYRYEPRLVEREKGSEDSNRAFLFSGGSIAFEAESGKTVSLYPAEKDTSLCRTKVLLVTNVEISETEKETLSSSGYDPARCRNITPEYWYGRTEVRLFVFGGKVVILDGGSARELLPEGCKLTSAALGEGEIGLYFTASSESGSSVWEYSDGKMEKILELSGSLAVIEPIEGGYDCVEVYAASPVEDGRFVTALECHGEPLMKIFESIIAK